MRFEGPGIFAFTLDESRSDRHGIHSIKHGLELPDVKNSRAFQERGKG